MSHYKSLPALLLTGKKLAFYILNVAQVYKSPLSTPEPLLGHSGTKGRKGGKARNETNTRELKPMGQPRIK